MHRRIHLSALSLLLLGAVACSEATSAVSPGVPGADKQPTDATLSVKWSATARELIAANRPSVPAAARQLAYLGMAQHVAAEAAAAELPEPAAAGRGAVAGASAALLTHFYPVQAPTLEAQVRAQEPTSPGLRRHFVAGELVGRRVAQQVIDRARADGFDLVFTGTIPVGPGYWSSAATPPAPPLLPRLGEMRPFFLQSGSQFRPAAPPAFGSAAYLAGLDEVRAVAAGRTAEQTRIAQFWALPAGTILPPGYWNQVGTELIAEERMGEREAARALYLLGGAMMDALIAGHDAKYAYWFVRPSKADPAITLAVGLPNHPSYPSTHTVLSKSAAGVLGHLFPEHQARLAAMAEEASISRLYGGIHYRFDLDAGTGMAKGIVSEAVQAYRGGTTVVLR